VEVLGSLKIPSAPHAAEDAARKADIDAAGQPFINYSTVEQDTGIKWYNDKTIYQRSFTGVTSFEANINKAIATLSGVGDFVDGWGVVTRSASAGVKIPGRSVDASEASGHFISDITINNGNIVCTCRSDIAIDPAGYLVTFQYTKV
jgi:hypothetical protein